MPRTARINAPGALHHIIARGIEQRKIFQPGKTTDERQSKESLMIFVPSVNGINHSPMEWTEWDDIAKGVSVLTGSLKALSAC